MTAAALGGLVGGGAAVGVLLLLTVLFSAGRGDIDLRVRQHLGALAPLRGGRGSGPEPSLGALLRHLAARLDSVVGGSASVQRRLERGSLPLTQARFRAEQVVWGALGLGLGTATALVGSWWSPERAPALLVLAALCGVGGVLARDHRLSAEVARHERQTLEELPVVAELMSLAVAAGEGPVAAVERVVRRGRGAFSADLARVLADIRTGTPVGAAFDALARRTGLPVVARFSRAVAVAVERGTPLADVLHAQAADVREAQRRALIETAARREVAMMVPVVFLVLPTTVLFAFWPGVVGLRLVV